jgi:beta-glucosidase
VWGAAAAAYQIEGAADEGGRGPSVWDEFCRTPGKVWSGQTGAVACDHYRRYREDIGLMRRIGLQAYRLSIAWPRVLPEGIGKPNAAGLDFYDRLIDALLEAGITPYVTLFHWDFPQVLQARGGWLERESADWFAEFAELVAARYGDRVRHWITLNEPQVFLSHGHREGIHAPGLKLPLRDVLQCGHHALLAHGRAVQALRAAASERLEIGYSPMGIAKIPASASDADVAAARAATHATPRDHLFTNAWWMDPIFRGEYPADGFAMYGAYAPHIAPGDLEVISSPIDFLGLNIYSGDLVRADGANGFAVVPWPPGVPVTMTRWPVAPSALYWCPRFLHERYGVPIYITENGMANADWPGLDGRVHDAARIDYLGRYLRELSRAAGAGADIRGYFHWSILDNFEWAEGYSQRFGLIHVDYSTQKRTLKDSAHWYAEVIKTQGASLASMTLTDEEVLPAGRAARAVAPLVARMSGTSQTVGNGGASSTAGAA